MKGVYQFTEYDNKGILKRNLLLPNLLHMQKANKFLSSFSCFDTCVFLSQI